MTEKQKLTAEERAIKLINGISVRLGPLIADLVPTGSAKDLIVNQIKEAEQSIFDRTREKAAEIGEGMDTELHLLIGGFELAKRIRALRLEDL